MNNQEQSPRPIDGVRVQFASLHNEGEQQFADQPTVALTPLPHPAVELSPASLPTVLAAEPGITVRTPQPVAPESTPQLRFESLIDGISLFEEQLGTSVESQRLLADRAIGDRQKEFDELQTLFRREVSEITSTRLKLNNIEESGLKVAANLRAKAAELKVLEEQFEEVDTWLVRNTSSLTTTQRSLATVNAAHADELQKLRGIKDMIVEKQTAVDRALDASRRRYQSLDEKNFGSPVEMVESAEHQNPFAIKRQEYLDLFKHDLAAAAQNWDVYKAYPDTLRHQMREALFVSPERELQAMHAKERIAQQFEPQLRPVQEYIDRLNRQIETLLSEQASTQLTVRAIQQQWGDLSQKIAACRAELELLMQQAVETTLRSDRTPVVPVDSLLVRGASQQLRQIASSDKELRAIATGRHEEVAGMDSQEVARHLTRQSGHERPNLSIESAEASKSKRKIAKLMSGLTIRKTFTLDK